MTVDYAKLGGPPDNWGDLAVYKDGELIKDVVEVNVLSSWAIRLYKDDDGFVIGPTAIRTYKDYGNFTIVEPDDGDKVKKASSSPLG